MLPGLFSEADDEADAMIGGKPETGHGLPLVVGAVSAVGQASGRRLCDDGGERTSLMALEAPWLPNLFYLCLVVGLWVTALALVSPGTGALEGLALLLLGGAAVGILTWPVNSLAFIPLILGAAGFVLSLVRRHQGGLWLLAPGHLLYPGAPLLFQRPP